MPGDSADAGVWGRDEVRNITGIASISRGSGGGAVLADQTDGAFFVDRNGETTQAYTGASTNFPSSRLFFDASRVVTTGPVTVPPHIWTPLCIYLGLST